MAQNLNEALLRLQLEVIGADAIKAAAEAVKDYGTATKQLQPARVETIIGAIDLSGPGYASAAKNAKEFADRMKQYAASVETSLQSMRSQIGLYADAWRSLGVPSSLITQARRQVTSEVGGALGLLPSDVEAISRSGRLYSRARTATNALNQMGSIDPIVAAEARIRATQAARSVAALAPGVLGRNIKQDPNYQLIQSAAGATHVDAADLQKALANLAPLIAEAKLLDLYRAALRLTAGQSFGHLARGPQQHPLFSINRQGFGPLAELNPELAAGLQGSIGLGLLGQPKNADLESAVALIVSQKQLVARAKDLGPKRLLSLLDIAQLKRKQIFGSTDAEEALKKLYQTEQTKVISEVEGESIIGGRYLDYEPGPAGFLRPRTKDVKAITAGKMQSARLPPTAIETTARVVGPASPGIAGLIAAAETSVIQSTGIIPDETILERFKRIGYTKGIERIEARIAAAKAKIGIPIPSAVEIPEPVTPRLNAEEELEERLRKRRRGRKSILPDLGGESGFARIRGSGSTFQQAIDMLEEYGQPTIFPKVFAKKLGINRSVGDRLIQSLQEQNYLGLPAGTGLFGSALPIIGAQDRRSKQAEAELNLVAEKNLTEATNELAKKRRIAARDTQKAAQGATAGGGGGVPPTDEEETAAGGGGRKGKGKGPPPPVGPLGRFGGRFLGLSYYLGAAAILYPILGALSQADQSAKELQTTLQRIQGIYGSHTLSEQLEIKQGIIAAARKYGENLTEVATAAERFAQAQESIKNIGTDLQTAAAGSRAFGTNMQQIAEFMIGIQEATEGKTTGVQGVNLVAALSRSGVVSPMSLMTAMQQLTPITNEQFAPASGAITDPALIGSILQTVSQRSGLSGTTVANSLRYMFARFGRNETAGDIEELSGVKLGTLASKGQELKPVAEILRDLAAAYKNFLETGQQVKATQLLTLLFGPRQIGPGAIFLEEMPKILRNAMEALNDTGALAERAGVQMSTLETAQKRLHNSLTELWGNSLLPVRTGIDNLIAKVIELANAWSAADVAHDKYMGLSPKTIAPIGLPPRDSVPPGLYVRATRSLTTNTSTATDIYKGIPMAYGNVPSYLAGSRNIVHEAPTGTFVNESRIPVGNTPDAFIHQWPPSRNVFAEIMLRGQISLEAQMRRAQSSAIAQQTQTTLQADRMLRQAQGRSTIGLELQGIESGKLEQGAVNNATFIEQVRLYQADSARVTKEIENIKKGEEYAKLTPQLKRAATRPLEDEKEGIRARLVLLGLQYSQEIKILDIKTDQAKQNAIQLDQMRQQVEKLRDLSNIGHIAQDFITQGLQGVAQALGGGGPGRGGRAAGAFLGAAASSLGGIMSQGLDLFGPQGAFPGVGKALYGKLGRPSEADITAQAAALAPAIQARFPGMSLITATELAKDVILKKVSKQQALGAIGQIGGNILGSAVGGNSQGANIGSTLGAAVGMAVPGIGPIIGGLAGGLIGGLFGHHPRQPSIPGELKIIADNSREQVRLLENTNKLLAANFVSFNVPTGFRLPSYQPGSFGGIGVSRGAGGGTVNSAINVNINVGGTNVAADKLGSIVAQAISDRLELESRSAGGYFPRMLYG